jgi:hypothetical protein
MIYARVDVCEQLGLEREGGREGGSEEGRE